MTAKERLKELELTYDVIENLTNEEICNLVEELCELLRDGRSVPILVTLLNQVQRVVNQYKHKLNHDKGNNNGN